jgi:hypothetical protein
MARLRRNSFSPDSPAPVESFAEEQAVPVEAPAPKILKLVATNCNLLEPYENIWFLDGKPREVYRVTKWIQAQIDAGLLKQA